MQLANITLALGGHAGNTVQKFGVTPAEIAVLREIHGEASVFDIQPLEEEVERTSREERNRLLEIYGKPPGSREMSAVEVLFPGAAARVFETLDELEIDESFFKATGHAKPKKAKAGGKPKKHEDEPEEDEPAPEAPEEPEDQPEPEPAPAPPPAARKATPAATKKKVAAASTKKVTRKSGSFFR